MLARNFRNVIHNYTEAQRKVRNATSNDAWGPPPALMHEIAQLTNNTVAYAEMMPIIWKRLNDHGKNWRHVYKSLVLLEHLLKYGNERIIQHCKENIFTIQTLKDFQYVEEQRDQGHNVREKSKQLVALIKDDERLRHERRKAQEGHERFIRQTVPMDSRGTVPYGTAPIGTSVRHNSMEGHDLYTGAYGSNPAGFGTATRSTSYNENLRAAPRPDFALPATQEEEQLQMQIALAESQREAEDEERRRRNDDIKLRIALERSVSDKPSEPPLSELVDFNAGSRYESSLFDTRPTTTNAYPFLSTTTSASPWEAAASSRSNNSATAVYQNDPWNNSDNDNPYYSINANGNDPWNGSSQKTPMTSATTWQPVTTTQMQPTSWSGNSETTRDPDSALSLNLSDPWGPGENSSRVTTTNNAAKVSQNNSSTLVDQELSDIFGSVPAVQPSNSNSQQNFVASSNPWSMSSTATTFPLPTSNMNSASPPMSNFSIPSGNLLFPTVISAQNNATNNSSPTPSATLAASRKTPESFLGDKFRTLVNLDELVTDPKASTNPFGPTSRTPPNPFMNVNKPPTLEQLTVSNTPTFSGGPTLPPPLIPSSFNGNSSHVPAFDNTNPFA